MSEAYRIELDWEEVKRIRRNDPITGDASEELDETTIYPAKHFVVPHDILLNATDKIREELKNQYD